MPNWCSNNLTITGPADEIERWVEFSTGISPQYTQPEGFSGLVNKEEEPKPEILNFHSIVPIPQVSIDAGFSHAFTKDADNNFKPKKDAPECGYDAQCRLWGTKWGACEVQVTTPDSDPKFSPATEKDSDSWIHYSFDTAWSPPEPLVWAAAMLFPTCIFNLTYTGEGYEFRGQLMLKSNLELVNETVQGTFQDVIEDYDGDEYSAWDAYGILDLLKEQNDKRSGLSSSKR